MASSGLKPSAISRPGLRLCAPRSRPSDIVSLRPSAAIKPDMGQVALERGFGHLGGQTLRRRRAAAPGGRTGSPAPPSARPPPSRPAHRARAACRLRRSPVNRAHAAADAVVLADEGGDERRRWAVVDGVAVADLLHPAAVHHRDAVRHRQRLALVVGDVDEGDADALLDRPQFRRACAGAAADRAPKAARRAAAPAARPRARGRWRRAASGRRTVRRDLLVAGARQARPAPAIRRPCGGAPWRRRRARAGRSRCSRRRSSAETAPGSGRSARSVACWRRRRAMSLPPMRTAPEVGSRKPEIVRRIVVLPQPEGPRIEKNSPPAMLSETSLTAMKSPKRMLTRSSSMSALMAAPAPSRRTGVSARRGRGQCATGVTPP